MTGELIEVVGKWFDLGIPDASTGGEITPFLGMWYSRLTDYVVKKSIIPGLGLKLKGGRCD